VRARVPPPGPPTPPPPPAQGWKPKWDEWLPEDKVMADDEAGRKEMEGSNAALEAAHAARRKAAASASRAAGSVGKEPKSGGSGGASHADAMRDIEESGVGANGKLSLPLPLKLVVVADWDAVTKRRCLPRFRTTAAAAQAAGARTVSGMIADFKAYLAKEAAAGGAAGEGGAAAAGAGAASGQSRKRPRKEEGEGEGAGAGAGAGLATPIAVAKGGKGKGGAGQASGPPPTVSEGGEDVCDALLVYFEKSLPVLLLYRFERMAWDAYLRERRGAGGAFADIAPPIFLLRLLVRLPTLLTSTQPGLARKELEVIGATISELVKWMAKAASPKAGAAAGPQYFGYVLSRIEAPPSLARLTPPLPSPPHPRRPEAYGKASVAYCTTYDGALSRGSNKIPTWSGKESFASAFESPPGAGAGAGAS